MSGNLSLGLTRFSDLLKLWVHRIFPSWTDTPYVGYASGVDVSGPIKKSLGISHRNLHRNVFLQSICY